MSKPQRIFLKRGKFTDFQLSLTWIFYVMKLFNISIFVNCSVKSTLRKFWQVYSGENFGELNWYKDIGLSRQKVKTKCNTNQENIWENLVIFKSCQTYHESQRPSIACSVTNEIRRQHLLWYSIMIFFW